MRFIQIISHLSFLAGLCLIPACGKEAEKAPVESTASSTEPVESPATQPEMALNHDSQSIFYITTEGYPNQQLTLPASKLLISKDGDQFHVAIRGDEPATGNTDATNSFRFDYTLDSGAKVEGSSFTYHANQTEAENDADGLSLQGGRQVVRPVNLTITIEKEPTQYTLTLSGTCQLIGENPNETPPQAITLKAVLHPDVVYEND